MKTAIYFAVFCMALSGAGCRSTDKLFDEGRYDQLISLAEKRMKGKHARKEKYVYIAEEAFRKATERDMARIAQLRASGRSEDLREILVLARKIERRQDGLTPFLPLVAENGYQAKFSFVKVHEIVSYAETEIRDVLYDEGRSYLSLGRNGDKHAARKAYGKFDEVLRSGGAFQDAQILRDEARALGTTHVLLTVDNRTIGQTPSYVEGILDECTSGVSSSFWTNYYKGENSGIEMDYEVQMVIGAIEVGPEVIREEKSPHQKKVRDGWQYVLDERGNVLKDSLGNDVKEDRYVEVSAVVIRTHQEKGVMLRGHMDIVDLHSERLLESRPIVVEHRFVHGGQTFFGDDRALDKDDRVHIGLLPFPSDASLIQTVAEMLRPAFRRELDKVKAL